MKLLILFSIFATMFVPLHCKSLGKSEVISPHLKLVATVDGKSYFADNGYRSWFASDIYCKSLGMQLASITTKNQVDALQEAYDYQDFEYQYWVSGRDSYLPRQFSWESGQKVVAEHIRLDERPDFPSLTCLIYVSKLTASHLRYYLCNSNEMRTLCET